MPGIRSAAIVLIFLAAGCTRESDSSPDAPRRIVPLTAADMDRFLAVIQSNDDALIPEFEPPEGVGNLDYTLPAKDLIAECRGQFKTVFDTARQGKVWAHDERWSRAFRQQGISGADFATLVRRVSCAVMRVRIDKRVRIERVVDKASRETEEIAATIKAIDDLPADDRTQQDGFIRAQMALRLPRLVALLEFSEMVSRTPPEDCALVRKYSAQLKPLLPQAGSDALLAEIQALVAPEAEESSEILPAGYAAPSKAQ